MIPIKDLQIGDWVCSGKSFPMQVVGTFRDVAYLDFEGNEADMWEVDENDIEPIEFTPEMFDKNGFKEEQFFEELFYKEYFIQCDFYNVRIKTFARELIDVPCRYVHELQHAFRICGIDKEIEL